MDDVSRDRDALDDRELDPFDVTDNTNSWPTAKSSIKRKTTPFAHAVSFLEFLGLAEKLCLTSTHRRAFQTMMGLVRVPPFERFYEHYRQDVLRHLTALLGRARAEDAFQETFLRALRAYPQLEHGRHLRSWVLTIATRIALDDLRRRRPVEELPELAAPDARPAYAELEELAGGLPPKERAAVVLRYGYDLSYAEIGAALGSSEEAARQAASSGVRRLRRKENR